MSSRMTVLILIAWSYLASSVFGHVIFPGAYRPGSFSGTSERGLGYNHNGYGGSGYPGSGYNANGFGGPGIRGFSPVGFNAPSFRPNYGSSRQGSSAYPGLGFGAPLSRCNGGNCGYWGDCHGSSCGVFYDFRPCHTIECYDGPFHGYGCIDGTCKKVCSNGMCKDFVVSNCSGRDCQKNDEETQEEPSSSGET
uniref:EGF-like domain-containing protein n=2 Tax=Mesocestoides corti TaxID=53468 RepID=A0A5K3FAY3_MESCO